MNRSKQSKARKQKPVNAFPPQIDQKPIHNRKIRFTVTTAVVDAPIDRNDLLKLVYTTSNNPVDGTTNWSAVQLRKVETWTVDNTGALASAALEWQSSRGPSKLVLASGNINHPAHLSTKPPVGSLASFWSQVKDGAAVNAEVLFYLTLPIGTIIDLDVNFVAANGSIGAAECLNLVVVAGATANTNYYNALNSTGAVYTIRPADVTYYNAV
jgi:hypothetical protein